MNSLIGHAQMANWSTIVLSTVAQIDHEGMINGCEAFQKYQTGNFFGRYFNAVK
jgi:hypothetical protein